MFKNSQIYPFRTHIFIKQLTRGIIKDLICENLHDLSRVPGLVCHKGYCAVSYPLYNAHSARSL
jgi:hypothetical protein